MCHLCLHYLDWSSASGKPHAVITVTEIWNLFWYIVLTSELAFIKSQASGWSQTFKITISATKNYKTCYFLCVTLFLNISLFSMLLQHLQESYFETSWPSAKQTSFHWRFQAYNYPPGGSSEPGPVGTAWTSLCYGTADNENTHCLNSKHCMIRKFL